MWRVVHTLERRAAEDDSNAAMTREVGLPLVRALLAEPRLLRPASPFAKALELRLGLGSADARRATAE